MRHMFSDVAPFRRDPLSFLIEKGATATRPFIPLAFGLRSIYLLADPEYAKPLLKLSEEVIDKGPMVRKVRAITGNNVLVLTGEEHKRRRAVLHSIVARPVAEGLTPVLAAETRKAIAEVAKDRALDARQFGASLALRLISVVAFGSNVLSPKDEQIVIESLRQAMADLADKIFRAVPPAPWAYLAQHRRLERSRQNMQKVVRHVRERTPHSVTVRSLGELGLSDREIADELLTFLLAGHDTTGAAAAWLFHAMATVPGLADQIAAEAAAIRDEEGALDVLKLPPTSITTAAVHEILRLYPSGYWFGRGILQDVELGGQTLRRGTCVMISPWLFHRSPRFWEAPDEFRLDRAYRSKAYLPFGTGPRVCIGEALAALELKIIALEVASAFHLRFNGQVGAPIPLVHLSPPPIPLEVRDRKDSGVDRAAPRAFAAVNKAEHASGGCPFHAASQ